MNRINKGFHSRSFSLRAGSNRTETGRNHSTATKIHNAGKREYSRKNNLNIEYFTQRKDYFQQSYKRCGKFNRNNRSPFCPVDINWQRQEPIARERCGTNRKHRQSDYSVDGSGNNKHNNELGSSNEIYKRIAPNDPARSPGVSNDLPNAREVSNQLLATNGTDKPDPRGTSDLLWQWGQFIDHDMTLVVEAEHGDIEQANILVPKGDPSFDPRHTGTAEIPFTRSGSTLDDNGQRRQSNEITAFLDGSQVYGSDIETANKLRSFENGELKTSEFDLLPNRAENSEQFLAGDIRVNEQPGLTAIHTLFVREHNRLANGVADERPWLNDEQIFQAARSKNIAYMQSITYNEFLPTLLGKNNLSRYKGYDRNADPSIANEFATAAFRFGHSMVTSEVTRIDQSGNSFTTDLLESFNNTDMIREHNIGSIIRGQAFTPSNRLDLEITDTLRNLLFGPPGTPGGGLDLGALNVQRGRDHELASYNDTREALGLHRIESFNDPIFGNGVGSKLKETYAHPDDIDLWIGGLAEAPVNDSMMGQTFTRINADQFERLRDGDRFYFENVYRGRELKEIRNTTLSDIIQRNSSANDIQQNAFIVPQSSSYFT